MENRRQGSLEDLKYRLKCGMCKHSLALFELIKDAMDLSPEDEDYKVALIKLQECLKYLDLLDVIRGMDGDIEQVYGDMKKFSKLLNDMEQL